jgi:uncharacterized membrane protein YheB (UPF0754 family)
MGCGVGWVTNAIAIDMLFKKYWKWGGVIVEHYKEFIDNMSQLVETDLVNSRTLKQELSSQVFKDVLRKWIEDILKKELPESSGSLRFADIPGIETSVDGMIALAERVQPTFFNGIYTVVAREKISELVSKEQYQYLVTKNVPAVLSDKDHYTYKIQGILADFLKDKSIRTLISDKAVRQIVENLKLIVQKVDLSAYNGHIDTAYQELLVAMDIDRIINDLRDGLSRMRFSDFVNNTEKLSRELVKKALDFARSPEGQALIAQIITDFLQDARRINLKLDDIVSPSVKTGIVRFCQTKMPDIIDKICTFIRDTRSEIEEIVNDTVDEQLDSTIGGKIGKFLKNIFIDNLAGKVNVIGNIVKALQQYGDQAGSELSKHIISLLENKTIGEIVSDVMDAGFIDIPSIAELINHNLRDLENKDINFIDKFLDRQIGETFSVVDLSVIKTTVLPKVFDKIKQDYLYTDRFKRDITTEITSKIMEIADKTITDFFDVYTFSLPLNVEKITNSLLELWGGVSEITIRAVLGENLEIPPLKRQLFQNLWDTHKNRDLNQLYKAAQNDQIYVKITEWIVTILDQNMDTLLTGRVSELVNNELRKMEPKEINAMVQDFMGKEMKSINILGAVMGLVIGGLSAAGASFIGVPSAFLWWMLAAYGGIFAAVGIGTNYLAIKMLFKPYKALLPGAKIPPFIGVVPARKPEFAKNIGNFVKDKMLGGDALTNSFISNKDAIKNECFKRLSAENYAVINTFLSDPVCIDRIHNAISNMLQSYMTANREKIANAAAQAVAQWVSSGKLYDFIPLLREGIVKKLNESDIALVLANLIEKEIEGKNLGAYKKVIERLMDMQLKGIFEVIAQNLSRDLTLDKVKKLIAEHDEQFVSYIANHSIADAAGNEVIDDLIGKITAHIGPMLHSGIAPIVKRLEKEEFNPNKKLDTVFNGALPRVLKKNIGFIIDMVSKEVGTMRGTLTDEIKGAMPFYAIPWKGHVGPIVNTLLDEELPAFLKRKQSQLESIIETLLENRLSDLGFDNKSLDIATIERAVAAVLDSPHVQQGVSRFAGIIIKQLAGLPIQTLLAFINIRSIKDVILVVEPLLSTAVDTARNTVTKDEVIDVIVKAVKNILLSILDTVTIAELVENIDLNKEMRGLFTKLMANDTVVQSVSEMIEEMLRLIEQDPSFYDDAVLRQDLARFIGRLGGEEEWERVRNAAAQAVKELLSQLNAALNVETKNAICNDYLLTAILNASVYNFPSLIRSIDVQEVVEREINTMHPAGIEKMFYKFAGSYFGKITFYGWIGIFGGFLSYAVGCALAIALR